jgi:hypothetical protein
LNRLAREVRAIATKNKKLQGNGGPMSIAGDHGLNNTYSCKIFSCIDSLHISSRRRQDLNPPRDHLSYSPRSDEFAELP